MVRAPKSPLIILSSKKLEFLSYHMILICLPLLLRYTNHPTPSLYPFLNVLRIEICRFLFLAPICFASMLSPPCQKSKLRVFLAQRDWMNDARTLYLSRSTSTDRKRKNWRRLCLPLLLGNMSLLTDYYGRANVNCLSRVWTDPAIYFNFPVKMFYCVK